MSGALSVREKVALDRFKGAKGPQYAYGIYWAARQAKALGLSEMCVIEFGVATGYGLITMENIAREVAGDIGLAIKVYGFDMKGLPKPKDYRDLPYAWQEGFYKMDEEKLRARLNDAELVLGNVEETVPLFFDRKKIEPIGFISIDIDYYSSTKAALQILISRDFNRYLPRTI